MTGLPGGALREMSPCTREGVQADPQESFPPGV